MKFSFALFVLCTVAYANVIKDQKDCVIDCCCPENGKCIECAAACCVAYPNTNAVCHVGNNNCECYSEGCLIRPGNQAIVNSLVKKGTDPADESPSSEVRRKVMIAVFFSPKCVVDAMPFEERHTVTAQWYVENCRMKVFKNLSRGRSKSSLHHHFVHQDKKLAHITIKIFLFIGASRINVIEATSFSPDLPP
ncbi:unnamed protein product [Darwinula stevensoni]|uniref:Uncharacterized protein n=1 Tax=Darwinula stevensoni TaxID=69355 RepID=A0A7R9AG23_9CRUS|nr:unnamed protein product [Darwinula stevensoni]CAG0903600.1 unnamed protein product [Darwinula stevensoni]